MNVIEAFLAMCIPTGIAVYLLRQDLNHILVLGGWILISLGVLGWLGADQPTELGGTPEEGSAKLVYFYIESGASALALALGLAAGVGVGLWASCRT